MILYVNGDSHSLGAMKDKSIGQSFVDVIADKFNLPIINHAEHASSASRIIRTTREFFSKNDPKDIMVLIGWGTWEREEWEYNGKYYNIMQHWYKHLPDELLEKYNAWITSLTPDSIDEKSRSVHKEIYALHQFLMKRNIPHLFFNCMYNFFGIKESEMVDWNNCYIGPYTNDLSYYWYLTNKHFESDHWYHFGADGHQTWADFLISYIKENNLL